METNRPQRRNNQGQPDAASFEQQRLQTFCRQLFRDMVKREISEHPLTARRRQLLIRYGASLGIDQLDSTLIVRGVEYECGQADSNELLEPTDLPTPEYLACIDTQQSRFLLATILLTGILLGLVIMSR